MYAGSQKIVLGTAQFGLDYGISNDSGKTPFEEAECIVSKLVDSGVFLFDTAPDYGESEELLKNIIDKYSNSQVITKIPAIKNGDINNVIEAIHNSIALFEGKDLSFLFHSPDDLKKPEYLPVINEVKSLCLSGDIQRIGGSVYNEEQIHVLDEVFNVDILQVPFNVFDQRLIDSKIIKKLRNNGCEIHVRSVFLQGLLLMKSGEVSEYFSFIKKSLDDLKSLADKNNTSVYCMCLKWVLQQDWVDKVVVGLNDHEQAEYLINNITNINNMNNIDLSKFNVLDNNIINPSRWP